MTTAFCFLAAQLTRLAALKNALDIGTRGPLAHVALRVSADGATVTASDGHLLAIVRLSAADYDGEAINVVIDGTQFARACGTLERADSASMVRIAVDLDAHEVRFTRGTAVAVARLVDLAYPISPNFIRQYQRRPLVPAIATFAPALLTTASRIIGQRRSTLLLWSPCADDEFSRSWSTIPGQETPVPRQTVRDQLAAPGIWADRELMLLVMPMRRSDEGAPDLTVFCQSFAGADPEQTTSLEATAPAIPEATPTAA